MFKKRIRSNMGWLWKFQFTISLFFILSCIVQAQEPSYIHYKVNNGLPSGTVYHAIQDDEGFIWFGTDAGVSRFDGVNFKNFDVSDGLSDIEVLRLFQDSKSRIWFLTFNGKLSYYKKGEIFNSGNDPVLAKVKNTSPIRTICEDKGGKIWFGSNNFTIIGDTDVINIEGTNDPAPLFFTSNNGEIFFPGYPGDLKSWLEYVSILKANNVNFFEFISPDCHSQGFLNTRNSLAICFEKDTTFIAIIGTSLFKISPTGCEKTAINFEFKKSIDINSLGFDFNKNLWLCGTNFGAIEITLSNTPKIKNTFLEDQNVSSALLDKEGNIWFTTLNNGVFFSNRSGNSLIWNRGDPVKGIAIIENGLIFFTHNSIKLITENALYDYTANINRSNLKILRKIFLTKSGKIIIIGDGGAYFLNFTKSHELTLTPIITRLVKDVTEDENEKLWFVKFGESVFPETPLNISEFPEIRNQLRFSKILSVSKDVFFFGSTGGVYSLNNRILTRWADKDPRFSSSVSGMGKGKNNSIWISTYTHGVAVIVGEEFRFFTKSQGLASNYCKSIYIDNEYNVWAGTNKGVIRIIPENNQLDCEVKNYSTADGLPSNDVNAVFRDGEKVYVGTGEGLSRLDLNKMDEPLLFPPVYITRVRIQDRDTAFQKKYSLPNYDNNIKIDFVGISYRSGGNLRYKYRLEGLEENWNYSNRGDVQYPLLNWGNYRFVVFAQANNGKWSQKPAEVYFSITPPWWATLWFKGLSILLSIIIITTFLFFRLRIMKVRNDLEKRLSELKIQALGLQMNPHFIFNSLNSIHSFISLNDKENARAYLSKFGKLVRGILDQSTGGISQLKFEMELLNLYLTLEQLRMGEKLKFEILDPENLQEEGIKIPSMLIQPFVENSIWHGIGHKPDGGKITIEFRETSEGHISVVIEDNGVGRKVAKKLAGIKSHKSISTNSIEERLNLLNSGSGTTKMVITEDLINEEGSPIGTKVTLIIPEL